VLIELRSMFCLLICLFVYLFVVVVVVVVVCVCVRVCTCVSVKVHANVHLYICALCILTQHLLTHSNYYTILRLHGLSSDFKL
jgi:hypothetical protein